MSEDRHTIGIAKKNTESLLRLEETGNFESQMDAAKFAMAYAISQSVPLGNVEGAETKWNVGSFDNGGGLKSLVEALYPDMEGPYRTIEYLLNKGLELLGPQAKSHLDVRALIPASSTDR
jgi:hypothetical protein